MVAGAIAGNISAEATTPTSNTFVEATRGDSNLAFARYAHCPSIAPPSSITYYAKHTVPNGGFETYSCDDFVLLRRHCHPGPT